MCRTPPFVQRDSVRQCRHSLSRASGTLTWVASTAGTSTSTCSSGSGVRLGDSGLWGMLSRFFRFFSANALPSPPIQVSPPKVPFSSVREGRGRTSPLFLWTSEHYIHCGCLSRQTKKSKCVSGKLLPLYVTLCRGTSPPLPRVYVFQMEIGRKHASSGDGTLGGEGRVP